MSGLSLCVPRCRSPRDVLTALLTAVITVCGLSWCYGDWTFQITNSLKLYTGAPPSGKAVSIRSAALNHPSPYQYSDQSLSVNVSPTLLRKLHIPPVKFHHVTQENVQDFVIVTGCDSSQFRESMDAVVSVQRHFPNRTVYYYDLGLTQTQRRQEVLQEHGAALWIDASIRIRSDDWSPVYARVLETGGIFALINTEVPMFATCHPALYNYFPVNVNLTKDIFQAGTGALLVYNTEEIYWGILHWWYLCALDPKCIGPTRKLRCTNLKDAAGNRANHAISWAKCGRSDQCVINVLFKMYYGIRANYPHNFLANKRELRPVDVIRNVSNAFLLSDNC